LTATATSAEARLSRATDEFNNAAVSCKPAAAICCRELSLNGFDNAIRIHSLDDLLRRPRKPVFDHLLILRRSIGLCADYLEEFRQSIRQALAQQREKAKELGQTV
jgi:hypothetical protein